MSVSGTTTTAAWLAGSLAAGLLLGLGCRSALRDAPEREAAAPAARAEPHPGPGHGDHGHAGTTPAATPSGKTPTGVPGGEHAGHDSHAAPGTPAPAAPRTDAGGGLLVDLGNATCPIMGGEPDGTTYSEWNGLRVSHCCPACTKKFLADPEGTLDGAGIEWRPAADAVKEALEVEGAARDRALEELGKRWTILRRPAAEEAK